MPHTDFPTRTSLERMPYTGNNHADNQIAWSPCCIHIYFSDTELPDFLVQVREQVLFAIDADRQILIFHTFILKRRGVHMSKLGGIHGRLSVRPIQPSLLFGRKWALCYYFLRIQSGRRLANPQGLAEVT